jgi:sulfite exporter TauE/SafE
MDALMVSGLLMGLFGGTHCVAMCGGIVGVVCGAAETCPTSKRSALSRLSFALAYNAGRIGSYVLLGLAAGAFGSVTVGDARLDAVRYALRAFAAVSMLAVGLHLIGLPSMVDRAASLGAPLWRRIAPLAKRVLPLHRPSQAFALGALWGFMPCGLLYGAFALAASADSPGQGAATMAAFGLGTLPVMLTMSALARTFAGLLARPYVRRAAGMLVLGFGLFSAVGVARQAGLGSPLGMKSPHSCCPGGARPAALAKVTR